MTVGIVGNPDKADLPGVLLRTLSALRRHHATCVVEKRLYHIIKKRLSAEERKRIRTSNDSSMKKCDLLISLGGDGTILKTARLTGNTGTPILGVNLGKLGFLSEVQVEDLESCLEEVMSGQTTVEPRMMLMAKGRGLETPPIALNDIVLDLADSSRVMHAETWVDGKYLATFTGDGIIVCTPTGSTGYALSNGGPIIAPRASVLMISPISPHTLTARPVVLPDTSHVVLKVYSAPARLNLTADGQRIASLKPPVSITVQKASYLTNLVKRPGASYFDVLRAKLQWGRDVRTDPR